jgi:hypothetical protein
VFPILALAIVVIIAISSWMFNTYNRDAKLKRKLNLWINIIAGSMFYMLIVWTSWDAPGRRHYIMMPNTVRNAAQR